MSDVPKRDLVLAPGTFAYIQDTTKGVVKTYAGPNAFAPSGQEIPVLYLKKTGTFQKCNTLEEAVCKSPVAVEGFYIILLNPPKNGKQPDEGGVPQQSADLAVGRKVNIPGPAMFPLWPGQAAEVIRGHQLRSNQFLLCKVYNEEEAKKNWNDGIVKRQPPPAPTVDASNEDKKKYALAMEEFQKKSETLKPPPDLTTGKLFLIKGTDVSFYIPPTGISVVKGIDIQSGAESYIREALTLENLEFCILTDENGNSRFERGPSVVFPEPTETFTTMPNDEGIEVRKFRAMDLNALQGIHVKVTADYEENGHKYEAGEELFITGNTDSDSKEATAIYYPRKEHAVVKYDGKTKHFATAVPIGEGRYVLNRETGVIHMVKGPDMLLPDPRTEILVRRTLSDKQCMRWYPGNNEALEYNRNLRKVMQASPTTRAGAVSEGDISRRHARETKTKGNLFPQNQVIGSAEYSASLAGGPVSGSSGGNYLSMGNSNAPTPMLASLVSKEQNFVGEEILRSSTYTQPRYLTLDTKYQGAPIVGVWTGYAVNVVSKTGKRRVELGPKDVLLEYDETLECLEFSTGKPKTTDSLIESPYLRVENNKISDQVRVETADHVFIDLYLSYRVNFEGDSSKWFSVENYVKFLCDHARSVLKSSVRGFKIENFYANSTNIIHDVLLGSAGESADRPGMLFKENGMRVLDVEVLGVTIQNDQIRNLLEKSQHDVVKAHIEVANLNRQLDFTKQKEGVEREEAEIRALTTKTKNSLEQELLVSTLALTLSRLANTFKELERQHDLDKSKQELQNFNHEQQLTRAQKEQDQRLLIAKVEQDQAMALLMAETESVVKRFSAAQTGFSEALLALSSNELIRDVAKSWNWQTVIGGENLSDTLATLFKGTPVEGKVKQVLEAVTSSVSQNGKSITSSKQTTV